MDTPLDRSSLAARTQRAKVSRALECRSRALLWAVGGLSLLLLGCDAMVSSDPTIHTGAVVTMGCVDCHQHDYNAAKFPDHVGGKVRTKCESCHVKTGWQPAKWDHKTWKLEGKHVGLDCSQCHGEPVKPIPKPISCAGCHMADYKKTLNPNHGASGYPTTCEGCHTSAGWRPAKGGKHAFPITSGKHNGIPCNTCHTKAPDFSAFTCMSSGCHPKAEMDDEHLGEVNNYSYVATECLKCHLDGKEPD